MPFARPALADAFATDARAAILGVLREVGGALTAAQVKRALVDGGVDEAEADAGWRAVQPGLRLDPQVEVEGHGYRWSGATPDAGPAAAQIATAAAEIDRLRPLAALASEVEELTVNQVDPEVLVRRVRAAARRSGLEPVERAGEATTFDPRRHRSIGPPIAPGTPVTVVRPGYTWRDVVLDRAVVEE